MNNSFPNWLNQLQLIAWDLDGTLYPSSQKLRDYIEEQRITAVAKHLNLSEQTAEKQFQTVYRQLNSHTRSMNALGLNGHDFFINLWRKINLKNFVRPHPQLIQLFTKVIQTGKFRHVLLTNANTEQSAAKKLKEIGLSPEFFDQIFAPTVSGYSKPEPEAFTPLWEKTGIEKQKIVYVGDRERTDILPAKQLGLRTIKVSWDEPINSAADWQISSPLELLEALLKL